MPQQVGLMLRVHFAGDLRQPQRQLALLPDSLCSIIARTRCSSCFRWTQTSGRRDALDRRGSTQRPVTGRQLNRRVSD